MSYLLPQLIERTAARAPQHQAIGCLDRALSYAELAAGANRLANTLQAQGVCRNDRVGIYMDKCLESALAIYGILACGAAYVPLDPSAPAERLAFILRDCGIRHLVTADAKLGRLAQAAASGPLPLECLIGPDGAQDLPWRCVPWSEVHAAEPRAPRVKCIEQDLAYVIYTSGSTGEPKGIMHTHHSGLSFARWAAREYGLRQEDRLANHAPLHFDLSILDYFAGAVAGATTVIVPEDYTRLPASYSALLAAQRVSVLYTVPFALIQLLLRGVLEERDLSALRWIIYGGEPFPVKHLRALMQRLPHVRVDNIYGPAEVNGVTHHTLAADFDGDSVPIGPIADIAEALVVDDSGAPVAAGESGELLVRTPTMMQGYWGRADLNRAAFFRRQLLPEYTAVYYRTGDLVREGGNGEFEFLGRKDRQVKVRGYRIELDEVEAALVAHAAVEEAAVFAVPEAEGSQQLRAAVTLKAGGEADRNALLAYLKERLSWYMLPAVLELRDSFPRTSTGKIDRRRLRDEALDPTERIAAGR